MVRSLEAPSPPKRAPQHRDHAQSPASPPEGRLSSHHGLPDSCSEGSEELGHHCQASDLGGPQCSSGAPEGRGLPITQLNGAAMGPEPVSSPSSPAHTTRAWEEREGSFLPTCFPSKGKPGPGLSQSPCTAFRAASLGQLVVGGLYFPLGFPLPHPGLHETIPRVRHVRN